MFGDEPRQADADAATPELDHDGSDDASFELANEVDPVDADDADDTGDIGADNTGDVWDDTYDSGTDDPGDADDDTEADTDDDAEVPFEPAFDDRPVPEAPATGDTAIDEAMTELAVAQAGSFEARIEAGERAHRLLQGRLGGLGEA
ncbi:hypothetical protein [Intrasporangium sp. YIM S08009]|uniref:hypothetical protein n=1 Tax=Intrasporangium zincisolvens TaxID=3080018 RepID=UPI002B0545A0|nr:hypothetical protein [Intrasporangium sp. YIM S08009]